MDGVLGRLTTALPAALASSRTDAWVGVALESSTAIASCKAHARALALLKNREANIIAHLGTRRYSRTDARRNNYYFFHVFVRIFDNGFRLDLATARLEG